LHQTGQVRRRWSKPVRVARRSLFTLVLRAMVTTIHLQLASHSRHVTSVTPPSQSLPQDIGRVKVYGRVKVAARSPHQKIVKENISIFVKKNIKTMARSKRDLATPLAKSGDFDPADYNKDGVVTPKEQKKYNKVQKAKASGKAKTSKIAAAAEAKVKKIKKKSNVTDEEKKEKLKATGKNILSAAVTGLNLANEVKKIIK